MENCVFFAKEGEMGLNETSAAHLCALANSQKEAAEQVLENLSFVNTSLSIVGSSQQTPINIGKTKDTLPGIQSSLNLVCKMNEFIAWFAEARKHLEDYKKKRQKISVFTFCDEQGIDYPEELEEIHMEEEKTLEDIIEELPIKERQVYLSLEAQAAVLGNFIHKGNPMDKARKEVLKVTQKPFKTDVNGRDTLIYSYEPSIKLEDIDSLYDKVQSDYRKLEQQLNHMKADLRNKLASANTEISNHNQDILQEYHEKESERYARIRKINQQFNQFKIDENTRLSKIKLAVPDKFKDTIKYLNSLG